MIPGAGNNDDHVLLLRTNRQDREMCVLFELVVVIEQPSLSGATIIEMACGWGTLPLYTLDGHALDGKTYDIRLSGGTPFDKEVPLAASTSGSPTKLWQMMRTTTSMPTLTVRVRKLGRTALASAEYVHGSWLC